MAHPKEKTETFVVEGPDWHKKVSVDLSIFSDDRSIYIEAASLALHEHYQLIGTGAFNVGPVVEVKCKGSGKNCIVNSYVCLTNIGLHKLAEDLRTNYKALSGQDLAIDYDRGYETS